MATHARGPSPAGSPAAKARSAEATAAAQPSSRDADEGSFSTPQVSCSLDGQEEEAQAPPSGRAARALGPRGGARATDASGRPVLGAPVITGATSNGRTAAHHARLRAGARAVASAKAPGPAAANRTPAAQAEPLALRDSRPHRG